jgi:hypothetical protein
MIFYKNVFISAVLSAILLIAIIGGVMYFLKNKEVYPPVINSCPDFYNLDSSNNCIRSTAWGSPPSGSTGCSILNFSDQSYLLPGSNEGSGICNKKNKAEYCGVTWDGITNNFSIC